MIYFITTSHSQDRFVYHQLVDISTTLLPLNINFQYLCVESSSSNHTLSTQYASNYSSKMRFSVLHVGSNNYWSGAFFSAIKFLLSNPHQYNSSTRFAFVNCDILVSDWSCLSKSLSLIESFVTVSADTSLVIRSGFNQLLPFAPINNYPFCGTRLEDSSSFYCESVPTRCIVFPAEVLRLLSDLFWLPRYLPHYGSDFIITRYISASLNQRWFVRNDTYLTEDTSSTGIKPINTSSLISRINSAMSLKSIYNWRLLIIYPILFCFLFLPFYYWLLFIFLYSIKFFLNLLFLY